MTPSAPPRAQNTQVTKLQQHQERAAARVSVSQVQKERSGHAGISTSAVHAQRGGPSRPVSSIERHKDNLKRGVSEDNSRFGYSQEEADERRYAHIRGLIQKRKQQEAKQAKKDT